MLKKERPSPLSLVKMAIDRNAVYWFPMRVANHRELRVRAELQRLEIEHYLPLKWAQRTYGGHLRRVQVPALNYIFVRSSQNAITEYKMYNKELAYLRYKMISYHDSTLSADVMTVSDHEIQNFMRATQLADDQLQYLTYSDFLDKKGRKVRVAAGDFMGVEGEIKRIKKNRCVVVCLRGIAAVAIHVPFEHLEFLE